LGDSCSGVLGGSLLYSGCVLYSGLEGTERGFVAVVSVSKNQIAANESTTECGGNKSERREMHDDRRGFSQLGLRDGVFGPEKMQFF
jgi:hypothetical protein